MRNIRIGVVEDDPASCQLVLDYLNRYQQENGEQFTVSVFDDGARIVEKYTPVYDILLLDIEMSEMDGMAAARRIRERDDKVVIVFITAAPQYAISGYEVRALSYLLKPLPWFAFSQELKKSIDMVRRNGDDSMLIETSNGQMRLNLADILYLESIRHTIVIHTLEGKLSINGTLKDMEADSWQHMLCVEAAAINAAVVVAPGQCWQADATAILSAALLTRPVRRLSISLRADSTSSLTVLVGSSCGSCGR